MYDKTDTRCLYTRDMNPRRRHKTERPFSFREKDRMRGYTIRQLYRFYPLSPTLPVGEGVYGTAVGTYWFYCKQGKPDQAVIPGEAELRPGISRC